MSVLGKSVSGTLTADEIETWTLDGNVDWIAIEGSELAARCPVTNNPDLYDWKVEHGGTKECESKSLKMYLMRFRDEGISCASLASIIAADLSRVLGTATTVTLTQQTRGGMRLSASAVGQ